MARRYREDTNNDNGVQDSFLDIVANIVGILILLVLVVGIRAAMQPELEDPIAENLEPLPDLVEAAEVEQLEAKLAKTTRSVSELLQSAGSMAAEADLRDTERLELATYIAAVEEALEEEKTELDEKQSARLDVRKRLAELNFEWQQLMLEKVGLNSKVAEPKKLINTPTPIVRRNSEHTIHLRLAEGHLAIVPLDELLDLMRGPDASTRRRDLTRGNGIAPVGPINGFVLRYAIRQIASPVGPMGIRAIKQSGIAEVRPIAPSCGEPVDEVLLPGASLSRAMESVNPHDTVFIMWVYPDGINHYRPILNALREQDFSVDIRLLLAGQHISMSENGRGTAAQ